MDAAFAAQQDLEGTLQEFSSWGAVPRWYADKRMKGWEFESTVPAPEDTAKLRDWQIGNGFETHWDLGVQ